MRAFLKSVYAALPFKPALFRALRAVWSPPERIYRHLHFKGVVRVALPSGGNSFRMRHHGYMLENELFWRGLQGWEKHSFRTWLLLCEHSQHIIDIGANTGVFALLAKAARPNALVVAVEPAERVFRMLEENIALNGHDVQALRMAVTDHDGTVNLFDRPGTEHEYDATLNKDFSSEYPDAVPVPVPGRTLDSLMQELRWPRVDVLKIDVEMHEPELLAGALGTLRRDRPAMLIEILNTTIGDRVRTTLDGLDYRFYRIDEQRWPPVRSDRPGEGSDRNYLVCSGSTAAALGLT